MKLTEATLPKNRWALWGTLASLTAFTAIATDLYLPGFPSVARQFSVTTYDVQLTLSSFFVGMAIGQLIWGAISDRIGRKLPMMIGIGIFVVGSIACAFAPSLNLLIAARFVQALGGSAAMALVRAIVRDLFEGEEMARTMSAVMSIFMAGPILAPSVGALIVSFANWNWTFIALAIYGVLALLNFLSFPETLPSQSRQKNGLLSSLKNYKSILTNSEFGFAVMQSATAALLLFSYVSLIPSVMMVELGVSPLIFGIFFGVTAMSLIVGGQINRRILKRITVASALKRFVIFQSAMAVLFFAVAHIFPVWWLILPMLMLTVGANTSIGGNSATLALAPFQAMAAQASALVGVIQSVSAALVAALVAVIPGEPLNKMSSTMLILGALSISVLWFRDRKLAEKGKS